MITITKNETSAIKDNVMAYRALKHPIRQNIINYLGKNKGKDISVTEIYLFLKIEQSVCSQHLKILRNENFVTCTKEGKNVYYRTNEERLKQFV